MIPIKILRTVRLFFLRLIKELKLLFTKHALNSIFQRILKKKKKKTALLLLLLSMLKTIMPFFFSFFSGFFEKLNLMHAW